MKKSIFKGALGLILIVGLVTLQACKKKEARNNLEGVWTYASSTINGAVNPITISGTYEFKECSGSDSKKGKCEMIQDLTLEYQGATDHANATLKWRVTKEDEKLKLILDDTTFDLTVSKTNLTLTSNEDGETVIMNFTK